MWFFRSFLLFIEMHGVQERAGQQIRARPVDSTGQCYQVNLQTSKEMLNVLQRHVQIQIHIQIQARPVDSSGQCYQVNLQTSMEMSCCWYFYFPWPFFYAKPNSAQYIFSLSASATWDGNVQCSANKLHTFNMFWLQSLNFVGSILDMRISGKLRWRLCLAVSQMCSTFVSLIFNAIVSNFF